MKAPHSLFGFLFMASVAGAQGQVHVVDASGGPGSDFAQIGQATAAAANGDIVLVRAGDYRFRAFPEFDGIKLFGKGLAIVADTGALVRTCELTLQRIPAGNFVLLQGLELSIPPIASIEDCAGPVWLSDVNSGVFSISLFADVMRVRDSAAFVVVRGRLRGDTNLPLFTLTAIRTPLHLFGVDVEGSAGGVAIDLSGAALWLFGSSVRGGDGLDGWNATNGCNGLAGGDGLFLESASRARILDSALAGGAGGDPFTTPCTPGANGRSHVLTSGSQESFLAGTYRSLTATSPVRDDEDVSITLTGKPGDAFALIYSRTPGSGLGASGLDGQILLAAPAKLLSTGTIPAAGTLTQIFAVPDLPPGVEGRTVFVQAVFRDVDTSRLVVSSPGAIVVLDDAF